MDNEKADIDQIIKEFDMDNSSIFSLANTLTNFFQDFEGIPIEDILDENDIIRLIQEKICDQNSDSEEEEILVSSGDAFKSLKTWISFFE